jgi:hypothetical protein
LGINQSYEGNQYANITIEKPIFEIKLDEKLTQSDTFSDEHEGPQGPEDIEVRQPLISIAQIF